MRTLHFSCSQTNSNDIRRRNITLTKREIFIFKIPIRNTCKYCRTHWRIESSSPLKRIDLHLKSKNVRLWRTAIRIIFRKHFISIANNLIFCAIQFEVKKIQNKSKANAEFVSGTDISNNKFRVNRMDEFYTSLCALDILRNVFALQLCPFKLVRLMHVWFIRMPNTHWFNGNRYAGRLTSSVNWGIFGCGEIAQHFFPSWKVWNSLKCMWNVIFNRQPVLYFFYLLNHLCIFVLLYFVFFSLSLFTQRCLVINQGNERVHPNVSNWSIIDLDLVWIEQRELKFKEASVSKWNSGDVVECRETVK